MRKYGIRGNLLLLCACLTLLLCAAIGYSTYRYNYDQVARQHISIARNTATEASKIINGDSIAGYLKNGRDDEYDATWEQLQNIKTSFGLEFLYVLKPNLSDYSALMVFDVYSEGESMEDIVFLGDYISPDDPSLTDVFKPALKPIMMGEIKEKHEITSGEFGYLVSFYLPLKASDGRIVAVIGSDISMTVIRQETIDQTVRTVVTAAAIILVFMFGLMIAVNNRIVQPIRILSGYMGNFLKDQTNLETLTFPVRFRDEFETMADSFALMIQNLQNYTKNIEEGVAERERMATELGIAVDVHTSLLPKPITGRDDFEVAAHMESPKMMDGCFYDFFFIDSNRLGIVLADISGGGIPAVLFMVVAKTMMKNQFMTGMSVDKAMTVLNTQLFESASRNMTIAAIAGVLDIPTGLFSYVNAGQSPLIIRRRNGQYSFTGEQVASVLAESRNVIYRKLELTLNQGDRLFFHTTVVEDLRSEQGERFTVEKFLKLINMPVLKDLQPEEMLGKTLSELLAFSGGRQGSDVGMLILEYSKGDKALADISVPLRENSFAKVLAFIKKQLNENGLGGAFYAIVAVTVEELLYMILKRAGSDLLTVRCSVYETRVEIRMTYGGRPENLLETVEGNERDAVNFVKGRASELYHEIQDGKNVLTLIHIAH